VLPPLSETTCHCPPLVPSTSQHGHLQTAHQQGHSPTGNFREPSGKALGRELGGEADWGLGEGTGDSLRSVLTCSWSVHALLGQGHLKHLQTAHRIGQMQSGSHRKPLPDPDEALWQPVRARHAGVMLGCHESGDRESLPAGSVGTRDRVPSNSDPRMTRTCWLAGSRKPPTEGQCTGCERWPEQDTASCSPWLRRLLRAVRPAQGVPWPSCSTWWSCRRWLRDPTGS
jgi:hypothetical protein